MKSALLLVCLAGSVGCGPALNAGLGGTWAGPVTASFQGMSPFSYSASMALAVSGGFVTVSGVCPGTGAYSIQAEGTGNSADWAGTLNCPPVQVGSCPSVAVTYTSALVTLNGNNTLSAQGSGTSYGCSTSRAVTFTFTGVK